MFSLQAENQDLKLQLTEGLQADRKQSDAEQEDEEEEELDVTIEGEEEEEEISELWDTWDGELSLSQTRISDEQRSPRAGGPEFSGSSQVRRRES